MVCTEQPELVAGLQQKIRRELRRVLLTTWQHVEISYGEPSLLVCVLTIFMEYELGRKIYICQ